MLAAFALEVCHPRDGDLSRLSQVLVYAWLIFVVHVFNCAPKLFALYLRARNGLVRLQKIQLLFGLRQLNLAQLLNFEGVPSTLRVGSVGNQMFSQFLNILFARFLTLFTRPYLIPQSLLSWRLVYSKAEVLVVDLPVAQNLRTARQYCLSDIH